ncbi:RluA family pseudouridine synthase [Horticoccus sp. 23ND18S-11]|uniref:RluA family pseudouridine synthase n=1 Tax=Horticoccus sp. 23ND18S-11 TaxID=3391832 RepID=UPI0039C93F2E
MSASDRFRLSLPLGREVTLIGHDAQGVIAFNKPAGVLSHPNEPGDERRSLLIAPYATDGEYFQWTDPTADSPGPRRLWLLNRLDSATSGVILAATSAELADVIKAHFKRKAVRKVYQALVFGAPRQPAETWRDRLAVEKRSGQIRTAAHAGHIPAESVMTVLRAGDGDPRLALLQLEPRTGRSHQLRVQCAKRHLPIVGDQTYGDFARNRALAKVIGTKRLFLHSMQTAFDYEYRGRTHAFAATAPLPEEFARVLPE